MVGPSNSTNRFGPSSYCVGPQLGNGVNFTDIQSAINQAVADGFDVSNPCTILVRPGVYTSFTMAPGILVEGVAGGSVFSNSAAVIGNVTIDSTTAGGSVYALKNMQISDPADAIIIQGVGPAIIVDIANCSMNGLRGVVIGNTSGTLSQIALRECRVIGTTVAVDVLNHNVFFSLQNQLQGGVGVAVSGDSRVQMFDSIIDADGTYGIEMTGTVNRVSLNFCNVTAAQEAIIGPGAGETVTVNHCTINSSAASGNWIDNVSIFEYYDVALTGTALTNNAILTNFIDWKPHAGTAANATLPGGVRGTCCFDSSQFNVTDGFVQASFSGLFPWVERNANATVNPNEGNFSVANITLTVPAQPQPIGTTIKFKVVTNDTLVIAGNPGDFLQIGSLGGTALTNTSSGDAIELTHYDLGIWIANSVVGNWLITP